jgi:hypothetical protein
MCRKEVKNAALANPKILLASLESFCDGDNKGLPSNKSMLFTGTFIFLFLCLVERTLRQVFISMQHLHPLLEDETNRNILARHLGVDSFSCFVIAYLGWKARYIVQEMIDAVVWRKNSMPKAYENRMFKYHPESCRICLYFLAYQVKNTIDTIVWDDGPEFIAHHVLTLFTAWGALIPGSAHFYAPFYLGFSEISTAVLCLLANFDDVHGVKGLAEAWPMGKVVCVVVFALTFFLCRVVMWSSVSYYYVQDAWNALSGNDPRLVGRKTYVRFTLVSLSLLTLLQIIWFGEILRKGKEELEIMGFL